MVGDRAALPRPTGPAREVPAPRRLLAIALAALLVRVALAVPALGDVERFSVAPDSFEYDQLGANLVAGRGYSQATAPPYGPDVRRTPGYPAALAAVYAVVGHRPAAAVAANVLFGVLACVLAAVLGGRLFGTFAGTLAGLLLAVDLTSAAYSLTIMAEPLFTVLLLLAALAAVGHLRAGSNAALAHAAILCGIATLVRPIGIFLPLALGPALALLRPDRAARARAAVAGAFVVLATLLPLGWAVRNYAEAGVAHLTSVGAINAYYHRAAAVEAQRRGVPVEVVRRELVEAGAAGHGPAPGERPADLAAMERGAWQVVLADPGGYLVAHLRGIIRMLGPDREALAQLQSGSPSAEGPPTSVAAFVTAESVGHVELGGPWLVVALVQVVAVYALALAGLGVGLRRAGLRPGTAVLALLVLYFLAASGPEAYARFRVPAMPFVAILAAAGALVVLGRAPVAPGRGAATASVARP